ncbi:ATP-dependent Clp protease, ATP-binding subunit clpA [Alkalidesulfovibrio alkalitolerans DSM 16529]|jgi:ATP-dependent Clp protease ATP-binding subunit ClpA|uniref:ATP-dependent Clp protease, ATP-binding subunit clpA n=1 Tax=Alkalidesulfovibrio alkalitolerans DSM 16529 TaxID=1121439 RepID=S7T4L4_9BACT|nr:ATP-dependent Clp protease ATP-binding subunit ClpA [Alkalidesulfovibrio alkalitolerans]EPR31556.1 ATP-dependent Clp protease, ATP-binding subunit clpA [Alkalidesulfovibrio alkalitolerans DSM 16529]
MLSKRLESVLTSAVREVKRRNHEFLTLEHLLYAMVQDESGQEILTACGADSDKLKLQLERFFIDHMEILPESHPTEVVQTLGVQRVLQRSIMHMQSAGKSKVEVGDVMAALFDEDDSYAVYFLKAQGVTRLDVLEYISHGVEEAGEGLTDLNEEIRQGKAKPAAENDKDAKFLEQFTVCLTDKAKKGEIDPLIGRDPEMKRTIQVLARRRKNNPIYVGDAGVGKTAMAEGLALKIASGDVPESFRDVEIFALDMGSLLAGTKYRGDFEQRLKGVVSAIKKRENAILFVDEIHTIIGAGATSGGTLDASNILKPMLASGEIRCIGSTTYEEYKNVFEKDRALSRRFQKIEVAEPTVEQAVEILKGLKPYYEDHHGVRYTHGALKAAAELSARYINDRFLPDKAIDVIDESGALCKLERTSCKNKVISVKDVEEVIARMARIPQRRVSHGDRGKLKDLEAELKKLVYGQDKAVEIISRSIKRSRAGLGNESRPLGSFLLMGPTGVGKTELAKQLAAVLGVSFLRYDMSEYMEKHAVARLIGSPPGYVGFDQGGLLVDDVRKNPYSVLLLDEIEKAHPDVFNILLQVMDYATLTDNNGRKADFRHVVILMTSNAGAREMSKASMGFGQGREADVEKGMKEVERLFSPEFRNRLDAVVQFGPLSQEIMEMIVDKFMAEVAAQMKARKIGLELTPKARAWLAQKGFDPAFGARPLSRVVQSEIKDPLADEILFGSLKAGGTAVIDLGEDEKGGEKLVIRAEGHGPKALAGGAAKALPQ